MQKNCTHSFKALFVFIFFSLGFYNAIAQNISTVAGVNTEYGDGLTGLKAEMKYSDGMTVDSNGNIFFTEPYNQTLRRIDTNNIVTLIAGLRQEPGFSGDGSLPGNATLNYPHGVAVDTKGNIYIADKLNNRIRKIDAQGIISTFAGNGIAGYGGDGGQAINATLNQPEDVAIDSKGNVFISDDYNNRIRKVDVNGIIITYAGNGNGSFKGENVLAIKAQLTAKGIATDRDDNLFIADEFNYRIRKINPAGIITTIAGNGFYSSSCSFINNDTTTATNVRLSLPTDVCADNNGNVYFVTNYCGILSVNAAGKLHSIISNRHLYTLTYSNGNLYFADDDDDLCLFIFPTIYKYNLATKVSTQLINQLYHNGPIRYYLENQPAGLSDVRAPQGLCMYNNDLYFAESYNYKIRKIDAKGNISTVAGNGESKNNGYGDGGDALNASFDHPVSVAFDKSGNFFVADKDDYRIRKIDKNNIISTLATVESPNYVVADNKGNLFVSTEFMHIYKVDKTGKKKIIAGLDFGGYNGDSIPAIRASVSNPVGMYVDKQNNLYIADSYNNRIRKIDTNGIITTIAGNGIGDYKGDGGLAVNASLYYPTGITQDAKGNFFIADFDNHKIRKIDTKGIITTVAGGGTGDYYHCDGSDIYYYGTNSGDEDSAVNANINAYDVAVNAKNNLLLSSNDIREITFSCYKKPIAFSYGIKRYINRRQQLNLECRLLCAVEPLKNYFTALNAVVTANVWVENKIIRDSSGKPFAPRHYQIVSERNRDIQSTAKFTLYFNQSEFDKYNSSTNSDYAKLPSSPTDTNGIAHLIIYMYQSKSKDSTGLPTSYTTSLRTINPRDENITWNDTGKYWQVTFNVNSLGGFFVGTEKINTVADKEELQIKESGIKVYPNPAADKVYITIPSNLLYKKIILCDANGKLVNVITGNTENLFFNLNNLSAGIYYVKFNDGTVKKLVHSK